MQAQIILALIAFYLLDHCVGDPPMAESWWGACAIPIAILIGPISVAAVSIWLTRSRGLALPNHQRLRHFTIGSWFAGGLILVGGLGWGSILRTRLEWNSFFPVDELLLFGTLTLSLVLCWAAEFPIEIGRSTEPGNTLASLASSSWRHAAVRARVYLVPVAAPLAGVLIAQTVSQALALAFGIPALEWCLNFAFLIVLLAALPQIFASLWRTYRLPPGPLLRQLTEIGESHQVRFRDVHVWPTGNQMANALVVGVFPRRRLLILTDRLMRILSPEELCAVVSHEAGHCRRGHVSSRIGFIVFPLVVFALARVIADQNWGGYGLAMRGDWGIENEMIQWIVALSAYVVYAFFVLAWISKKMEFQADLFACERIDEAGRRVDRPKANLVADALGKLAGDCGEDATHKSWLHPSIAERIAFIFLAAENSTVAKSFERNFARQKRLVTVTVGAASMLLAIVC